MCRLIVKLLGSTFFGGRSIPDERPTSSAGRPYPPRSVRRRFIPPFSPVATASRRQVKPCRCPGVCPGGFPRCRRRRGSRGGSGVRWASPEPLQVQQQAGGVRPGGGFGGFKFGVGGHFRFLFLQASRWFPSREPSRDALMVPYGIGATAIAPRTAWKLRLTRRNSYCALRVPLSQSENPVSGCPAAQSPAVYAFQQSGGFEPLCCQLNGSLA